MRSKILITLGILSFVFYLFTPYYNYIWTPVYTPWYHEYAKYLNQGISILFTGLVTGMITLIISWALRIREYKKIAFNVARLVELSLP